MVYIYIYIYICFKIYQMVWIIYLNILFFCIVLYGFWNKQLISKNYTLQ